MKRRGSSGDGRGGKKTKAHQSSVEGSLDPVISREQLVEGSGAEIKARRNAVIVPTQDVAFGHSTLVSARTLPLQLLASVKKRSKRTVHELMRDRRMTANAVTTAYSYADSRTPLVEAFATGKPALIVTLFKERWRKKGVAVVEPPSASDYYEPTPATEDWLALKKYAAPTQLQEPLLTQLVRRNVPLVLIEQFRPVSLFLDRNKCLLGFDENIVGRAHGMIGENDGEFYTADDYGAAAVEALRYGHCSLALDLADRKQSFNALIEKIMKEAAFEPNDLEKRMAPIIKSRTDPFILSIHATAALGNRVDVLEWLHDSKCELDAPDGDGWTSLHYAAAAAESKSLTWLIGKGGPQLVTFRTKDGTTPLHAAVRAGRTDNVKIILAAVETLDNQELRESCNWKTEQEESALYLAAGSGESEIVELLSGHAAIDIECRESDGLTPLMAAASRGHSACIEILLRKGANAKEVDHLGRDAVIHAAINGQTNAVAFLLKSTDTRHDSADSFLNTALHYACAYGWLPIVKMLVEVDPALLDLRNGLQLTPSMCAYRNGQDGILSWLLENGHNLHEDASSLV